MALGPVNKTPTKGPVKPSGSNVIVGPSGVYANFEGIAQFDTNEHYAHHAFQFRPQSTATNYPAGSSIIPRVALFVNVPMNLRFRQIFCPFTGTFASSIKLQCIINATLEVVYELEIFKANSAPGSLAQIDFCAGEDGVSTIASALDYDACPGMQSGFTGFVSCGAFNVNVICDRIQLLYYSDYTGGVDPGIGILSVISQRYPHRLYHEYNFSGNFT